MELWSSFTYQLWSSAKAALIFFTELSTSSLIIIRYLVRETVQRCKSFTDFSMFGPEIENKNCTGVRKLVVAFLNDTARTVQHVICPDEEEVVILLNPCIHCSVVLPRCSSGIHFTSFFDGIVCLCFRLGCGAG